MSVSTLLTLLVLVVAGALAYSGLRAKGAQEAETAPPSEVPAWDGSPTSTLPDAIEKKVRGIQSAQDDHSRTLEHLSQ